MICYGMKHVAADAGACNNNQYTCRSFRPFSWRSYITRPPNSVEGIAWAGKTKFEFDCLSDPFLRGLTSHDQV